MRQVAGKGIGQQVDEEAGGEVLAGVLVADAQRVEQPLPARVAGELDDLDVVGDLGQVGPAVVALGVDVADHRALQGGEEHQVLQQHRLARARRAGAQHRRRARGAAGLGEVEQDGQLGGAQGLARSRGRPWCRRAWSRSGTIAPNSSGSSMLS